MSDYQTLKYQNTNYQSTKFKSTPITDIYTTSGSPPPTNYIGCFSNVTNGAEAPNSTSVTMCENVSNGISNQFITTQPYPYFGTSNFNGKDTSTCNLFSSGVSSFTNPSNMCVQGDDGNYYGTGSATAIYSSRFIKGCENDPSKLICPLGKTVSGGTIKYGRWDNTICPGIGVSSTTVPKFANFNISAGTKSISGMYNYVGSDPYPNVFKHYELKYTCS